MGSNRPGQLDFQVGSHGLLDQMLGGGGQGPQAHLAQLLKHRLAPVHGILGYNPLS